MYLVLPTVTALIINDDGKVLLGKRVGKPPKPYIGFHALIGGKIEKNEDPIETLYREVTEETGLVVEKSELLAVYHHRSGADNAPKDIEGGPGLNICFIVTKFIGNMLKEESDLNEFEWVEPKKALTRELPPWDRYFLGKYLEL